jgi:hypothetical protein
MALSVDSLTRRSQDQRRSQGSREIVEGEVVERQIGDNRCEPTNGIRRC